MRRHAMLWMKTRTALMFCVSVGKGEGGNVVRALANVLFGHASERLLVLTRVGEAYVSIMKWELHGEI